jgi:hypothetical protein
MEGYLNARNGFGTKPPHRAYRARAVRRCHAVNLIVRIGASPSITPSILSGGSGPTGSAKPM